MARCTTVQGTGPEQYVIRVSMQPRAIVYRYFNSHVITVFYML